jgi:flagellar basal body L-ring protein FlgH
LARIAQFSWIQKTDFQRHGKAMQREVGVIKLTAKPASVLANDGLTIEGRSRVKQAFA